MARLTSLQRDTIRSRMVTHVQRHLTQDLEDQLKIHSAALYEISMPKHVRTAIEILPRNLFRYDTRFEVICRGYRHSHVTALLPEAKAIPHLLQPLELQAGDEGVMLVYERIADIQERIAHQNRRTYELQNTLQHCLDMFNSPNKLVHHWPEIFNFLPPVVQLSDRVRDFSITSRQEAAIHRARSVYNGLMGAA